MKSNPKAVLALVVLFFPIARTTAQDYLNQPYENWTRNQVIKVINDSPWARSETLAVALGGRGSGVQGEKEIFNKFTVRFFSARPVREAYVRMMQVLNNYDEMTADQRGQFNARFDRALNLDVSDRVIVALEFASNDPEASREMKRVLEIATAETLKANAYLISERLGRVQLREYFPPSPDGTGAKFIFPRSVNGKSVIEPSDKEARFEFHVPLVDRRSGGIRTQRLLVTFKVAKMLYRGELSY